MKELTTIFAELGISQYLHDFLEQGFDTWETVLDITESDFDALGVKLGHRRKLQRKIANSPSLSSDRALAPPSSTYSDNSQSEESRTAVSRKADGKDGSCPSQGAKRKYRRHPEPDENAPGRPPSAYVIFLNKKREEIEVRNLSFAEIAKLVGENWQKLTPTKRDPYKQQAFFAKERYYNELAEYKKTNQYKEYAQYLAVFKAWQAHNRLGTDSDATKRPKLEARVSATSSGAGSSLVDQHDGETPSGRARVESSAAAGQWHSGDGATSLQFATAPKLSPALGGRKSQGSPKTNTTTTSPTDLQYYRDSIYGTSQQAMPWRDSPRDDAPDSLKQGSRIASGSGGDRRPSYAGSATDKLNLTGLIQHAHRTGQGWPPSLPTSESTSTVKSSASSGSPVSSTYFTPCTPVELPLERALPMPALYPQNSNSSFDHQLTPLRLPSSSPRSTLLDSRQSPNGIRHLVKFPPSMAPLRSYTATAPQQIPHNEQSDARDRDLISSRSRDDNILDPISALIRAGEIVNQNGRGCLGS